ncbi:MAG: hypothetical protein Q7U28_08125 [Aquabacterium sp.]|nr:hypothetical protein [Aquabacterium sp.]
MKEDDIPLFPVAQVSIGPVPRMGIVVMRLDFLSTVMDTPENAQTGRTYAMTPVQVHYVIEQLQRSLVSLDTSAPPDGGGPTH